MTIALLIEPEDQTVDPGGEAAFTVQIVNQSGVVDRVALDILGLAGGWARTEPPAVALMPGTDATAVVYITPPLGTPLGPVPIGIRGTAETSGFVEVGEANLNVGASRSIEAELRPRTATGKRRATSVVVLHNSGNAPTKVQVVATDPDDAIVFDAPTAVQLGPGATAELPLRMRLPSREKQGASLPYSVLVEGGDTGQSLDGLVRQPAKKRWPLLALMMLLALVLLAVLLLKPQNSKAIPAGKPDDPTVPTLPGATTTVPAAVTTVAGPATTAAAAPGPGGPAPTVAGGGPVTTKAPTPGSTAPPTLPPTTTPAKPAVVCPGVKGTPKETAQRVVCAWQAQPSTLQGEIDKTITGAAATSLVKVAPSPKGQVAGTVFPDPAGSRVTFACPTGGGGIQALIVGSTGLVTALGPSC